MKQLTVLCSRDLEDRVVTALDNAGVEGYARHGDVSGNKFMPQGQVPRTMTWEAVSFMVPAATDQQIESITGELRRFAGSCEIQPCLRMVVTDTVRVL
jgi:hypothetical protein